MLLTIVAFAGFYESAKHAAHYADILAEALHGRLVLLHVSRASPYDSYALVSDGYHRSELSYEANTASALYWQAEALHTPTTVEIATDLLPAVAQDVAQRHWPVLFVLGQLDLTQPAAATRPSPENGKMESPSPPFVRLPASLRPGAVTAGWWPRLSRARA